MKSLCSIDPRLSDTHPLFFHVFRFAWNNCICIQFMYIRNHFYLLACTFQVAVIIIFGRCHNRIPPEASNFWSCLSDIFSRRTRGRSLASTHNQEVQVLIWRQTTPTTAVFYTVDELRLPIPNIGLPPLLYFNGIRLANKVIESFPHLPTSWKGTRWGISNPY